MGIEWISQERVFLVREGNWKMPMDMVSFAISTGLGVSLVAGLLSGVCYVLVQGSHRKRNRKSHRVLHCGVCGEYFRSIDHILGGDSSVTCSKCQTKVCQKRCARAQQEGWICKNCLRPPENWFQGILQAIQPTKKEPEKENMDTSIDTILEESNDGKTKEQVQDFIEKLVNSMLGQNVDDVNVTKLYNDEHYDKIFEKYHRDLSNALTELGTILHNAIANLPLNGQQSPCTAHAALKQLIEKLLQEVIAIPHLQKPQNHIAIPPDLNNRTYEDLLATAILNKVISNSQLTRPSSSAASVSSRLSNSSNTKDEKEYFFGEETLDHKWKQPDLETTSVSSLEDWLQSDSSFGSRKYVDRLTLTIKQDIEEVSQISESDEDEDDDDSEYFRTKSSLWSDDEPNWILQKRQFQGTHSPVPVPMLVPNPTTEAKVLIGDKEIEDTSDLSDVESEFGEPEIVPAQPSLLIDSKNIIGGKNVLQNGVAGVESESESSADSGVKEVDRDQSTYDESEYMENINGVDTNHSGDVVDGSLFVSKADITVDDDNVEDSSLLSVYSNIEQEAEYTEQYASLPRKIEKRPQPPARPSLEKSKSDTSNISTTDVVDPKKDKDSDEEVKMVQLHFSGSYSRREKEKWKNAIEMKNNPYSKENIERRIQRSNSGAGSIFGPDYYAKLAASPSGTKTRSPKSPEVKELSWPPSQKAETEENFNNASYNIDKYASKVYIASEEEDQDVHTAIPIIIDSSTLHVIDSQVQSPKYPSETHPLNGEVKETVINRDTHDTSPSYIAEVTSDSDLSYINCYDVENSQVYKKSTEQTPQMSNRDADRTFAKNPKSQRNFKATRKLEKTPSLLRRHKSESDIINAVNEAPRVIAKKKDNTLISKIYKSLSKGDLSEYPTFRTQMSAPHGGKKNQYNSESDDEFMSNRKYGSQEALFSSSSNEASDNRMSMTKQLSLSSEEEHSDQSSFYSEYRSARTLYSSQEDLLSIDDADRSKKRDNTLIAKIYKQPHVRNYALSKREHAVVEDNAGKKVASSDDDVFIEETHRISSKGGVCNIETTAPKTETEMANRNTSDDELGVQELAKKKIVHNILSQISRIDLNYKQQEHRDDANGDEIKTSVKDLMRKFENNLGKNQLVSSLTARSLSRHTRKPLGTNQTS